MEAFKIQHLRQFVATADHGSFQAAAHATFRSQAAVSAAMDDLERQVGGALFEPGKRARPTPLGMSLLPLFRELLAVHDRIRTEAHELAHARRGAVALAVMPSLADEWLPDILARYTRDFPKVRLRAVDIPSQAVRQLVLSGEVDIGIAGLLADEPRLDFLPIARDEFGIICPAGHPLARARTPVEWSALAGERLIGNATFEALRHPGIPAWVSDPDMTITNRTSLIASVRSGLGITILPVLARPARRHKLAFVRLRSSVIARTVGLVTRPGQSLSPAARHMFDLLVELMRELATDKSGELIV
ncbi:HTH-type transcriptional regulator CysL [Pigmentiphaga humi]|uniref:HTH-type transcriptional regulator CysL n=1 Tax=Pigmentiphaga humi TaxID=2478468 RepID=A0A3P4B1S0_9BURK|nr:LysR family transcriptional regulator [Pigmentiphaga humi]VCU69821.1 HTH-type transcriptional regulator CysL [Pigmentiphaga humi]